MEHDVVCRKNEAVLKIVKRLLEIKFSLRILICDFNYRKKRRIFLKLVDDAHIYVKFYLG